MEYLLGLIAVLGLGYFFERNRRKSAEAVLDNVDTIKEVNNIDASTQKNNALNQAEEEKRESIKKGMEDEKSDKDSLDELADFLNKQR